MPKKHLNRDVLVIVVQVELPNYILEFKHFINSSKSNTKKSFSLKFAFQNTRKNQGCTFFDCIKSIKFQDSIYILPNSQFDF